MTEDEIEDIKKRFENTVVPRLCAIAKKTCTYKKGSEVDVDCWHAQPPDELVVRGKTYLTDKKKIIAKRCLMYQVNYSIYIRVVMPE